MAKQKPNRQKPTNCVKQRGRTNDVRKQPKKDSSTCRVNFDNTREGKFIRDIDDKINRSEVSNDPNWYFNNSKLGESATQITMIHPTGLKEQIPLSLPATPQDYNAVPGVLAMLWDPIIAGRTSTVLKQAADSIYSYVVHGNSRNYNYNASDQMMLILGTGLTYSFLANAIRAYGVMMHWNGIDFYTPRALVAAMGFSYDNLKQNLHAMRFGINQMIAQINQLWIPNTLPIFERWFWMNMNIYRDGNTQKAQYYLYVPSSYFIYNQTPSTEGNTNLDQKVWMTSSYPNHTWSEWLQIMQSIIDSLVNSEDRGTILGDLLTAYGADKIYRLNPIDENYTTPVVYDEEVLMQIENASVFGGYAGTIVATANGNIASQGSTISATTMIQNAVGVGRYPILNFHKADVTPSDIMVATRMTLYDTQLIGKGGTAENPLYTVIPTLCGTEMITNAIFHYYTWPNAGGPPTLSDAQTYRNLKNQTAYGNYVLRDFWIHESFDWAPWVEINDPLTASQLAEVQVGDSVPYVHRWAIGDYDNYVFLDEIQLQNLHTAAIYSLFAVPVQL